MVRKPRINRGLIVFFIVFILTLSTYVWFINSRYLAWFADWSEFHQNELFFVIYGIKMLSVIWPPIPGGIFTFGSIPFLGWSRAYMTDFLGSISGAIITYHLGKHFGYDFLKKILHSSALEKINKLKINENIGILFIITILGETTFFGVISYGAGLFKVRFWEFLFVAILSHIILILPAFYLASTLLEGKNKILSIVVLIIIVPLFYSFKRRFFQ